MSGLLTAAALRGAGCHVDVAFGYSGVMRSRYEELGCIAHVAPHGGWLRGGNALGSARRLLREWRAARPFVALMRQTKPDLVYINSLVSLAPALAARRLGIPCVWHVRELFVEVGGEMHAPAFGGKRLVRWALRRLANRVVCISQAVAENVLGRPERFPMMLVPNAVDDSYFEAPGGQAECRRRLGMPETGRIVGVPGTLRPVKGHPFFLEAAAEVARKSPDVVFAITGEGETKFRQELDKIVGRLGLADRVRFLGTLADMRLFYRACDAVCVPSRSESFGRTVIEAFASGTPVVATAVGGIRETVDDGQTGLLVPYGDVPALTGALLRLLSDPALRDSLAHAAREKAQAEYRAETYQRRIVEIVTAVAGRSLSVGLPAGAVGTAT